MGNGMEIYHLSFLAAGAASGTTMPRNPLVSANGNADDHASQLHQLRGDAGSYYTTLGFW